FSYFALRSSYFAFGVAFARAGNTITRMSLILKNLCKSYPTRSGVLTVLRDIHLTLQAGESLAILGPSGSGKSTLLYLLGTLERPTSGAYKLGEQEPFG